ncbi:hypothetical protein GUJ93_ZPchr0005g14887 [Zizania palustris]|uniref:Uncharacterized protein n=1 Tax=Zizania palustris TaxID=103762 RepID=A0A8J5S4A4_ZIZPA|nr:hypothetical protein GUJ93_ZPchr0005g14887 [Zizania palustris]
MMAESGRLEPHSAQGASPGTRGRRADVVAALCGSWRTVVMRNTVAMVVHAVQETTLHADAGEDPVKP